MSGVLEPAGNVSVNGQRETANAFLVNGGDVSEGRNLGAGLIPNLDSIEEFRLITNSFDAEYGKFSGAVMNAITKSGTNGIHGTASSSCATTSSTPAISSTQVLRTRWQGAARELRRNQFGYAVGGPFWKNKLFWFTDYQGTRQVAGAEHRHRAVAHRWLSARASSQPADSDRHQSTAPYWAQVLSQRLGYGVTNGEPYSFAGCTLTSDCVFPGGVIPQRAFVQAGHRDPAVHPAWQCRSQLRACSPTPARRTGSRTTRPDSAWTSSTRRPATGRGITTSTTPTCSMPFPAASVPGFPSFTPTRAQQIVMSNTKTLGPTAVNEARVSFFRTATTTDKPKGSFAKLSDLGFVTGIGTLGINPSGPPGFPQYVPPTVLQQLQHRRAHADHDPAQQHLDVPDGFSKVIGSHTLKFGGEFRYLQINERNVCAPNGDFTFDGSETGVDFADFLMGAPAYGGFNQCSMQFLDSRTRYGGAYAQDSWKVKPNFTLNLGVRWEVSMPWYDTQGKIETIVPGLQSTQFPTAPMGWVVPGDPGIPATLAPTHYNNFAPRVGLAYSPGFTDGVLGKIFGGPGKTSIRARSASTTPPSRT